MTLISKNSDYMRNEILQAAYRIMNEREDGKCTLELALALLACRYTSPQYRMKAAELLEEEVANVQ